MEKAKRTAGDYEIIQSFHLGDQEIVLGYDPNNKDGDNYMTAYCQSNELWRMYTDIKASPDYAEVMEIFATRLAQQAGAVRSQIQQETAVVLDNRPYTATRCKAIPGCKLVDYRDDLNDKIVIVRPDVLRREYQVASHQLMLCVSGFGASPNSRGSACYCVNLLSGESSRFERSDILATLDRASLPEWAEKGLEQYLQKKQATKEVTAR